MPKRRSSFLRPTKDARAGARRRHRESGYFNRRQAWLSLVLAPVLAMGVVMGGMALPANATDPTPSSTPAATPTGDSTPSTTPSGSPSDTASPAATPKDSQATSPAGTSTATPTSSPSPKTTPTSSPTATQHAQSLFATGDVHTDAVGPLPICATGYTYSVSQGGTVRQIIANTGAISALGSWSNTTYVNGLAIAANGSAVYAFDRGNVGNFAQVLKYTPTTDTWAKVGAPYSTGFDGYLVTGAVNLSNGNYLFGGFDNSGNFKLWQFNPSSLKITVLGGFATGISGGNGDMAFDAAGNLYIVDSASSSVTIFTITAANLAAASGGPIPFSKAATVFSDAGAVNGIAFDSDGTIYLGTDSTIYHYDPSTWKRLGTVTSDLSKSTDLASCNSPGSLTIQKNLVGRAAASDQFTLTLATGSSTVATVTTTGSATGVQSKQIGPVPAVSGSTYNFSEAMAPGSASTLSSYTTTWTCSTGTSGNGTSGSVAIPKPTGSGGVAVNCVFTNTPKTAHVTVTKTWTNAIGGDTAGFTATGLANGSSTAPTEGTVTQGDVTRGTTVNVAETLGGGNSGSYTTAVTCKDSSGVTLSSGALTTSFVLGSKDVTCAYRNSNSGASVKVTKNWVINGTAYNNTTAPLSGYSVALGLTGQQSVTSGQTYGGYFVGQTVTVSETSVTVPDGCTNLGTGDLGTQKLKSGVNSYTVTNTVTCGASVVVKKNWTINGTNYVNGSQPAGYSAALTLTGQTNPAFGTTYTNYTQGDKVTVGENATVPSNCTNTPSGDIGSHTLGKGPNTYAITNTVTCTATVTLVKNWGTGSHAGDSVTLTINGGSPATPIAPNTGSTNATVNVNSTVTVAEAQALTNAAQYTGTLICDNGVKPGSDGTFTMPNANVTCTYTNTPNAAVLKVQKNWQGNPISGDIAALQVNGITQATSTSTGANGIDTNNVASVPVTQGQTVNVAELLGAQNKGVYTSALSCPGVTVSQNGTFQMPRTDVTCTFTNTAQQGGVTLTKTWAGGVAGDTAGLSINGSTPDPSSTSTATGGNQTDTTHKSAATVSRGSTVTLGEQLGGTGHYTAVYSCTSGTTSIPVSEAHTFRMPAAGDVTCVVTNTAATAQVTLTKVWVNGVAGDTAGLAIASSGATTLPNSSISAGTPGTVTDSAHQATATVSQGAQVTLSETLAPKNGSYTTTYACTGATPVNGVFTMPTTGNVNCTVTNTAKTAQVTLTKTWVGGVAGDVANLSIAVPGAPNATYASTAKGGDQTDATGASATVPQGASVTVGETIDPSKGSYTSGWVCKVNGDTISLTDDHGFTMPSGDVDCVVTNTAATNTVTLTKTWKGGVKGDKAGLIINGSTPDTASTSVATGGDQVDTTHRAEAAVSTGSTVSLGETLTGSGTYGAAYTCTDGDTNVPVSNDLTFTMPSSGAVTCVVTNTAVTAPVSLFKDWVGGVAGDTAGLIINGSVPDAQSTSIATGGNQSDNTHFATATASTGSIVELDETLTGNGDYTPAYVCTDGDVTVPVNGNTFTMPVSGSVVCVVTNTAASGTVSLTKTWVGGVQGDTAGLKISVPGTPGATHTSTAVGGNQTDATGASETVSRGAQVTLGETLAGAGVYTTGYACTSGGEPLTLTGASFTMPASGDVSCVVTNTAATAQVTLTKVWVDGVNGDTANLSIASPGAPTGANSSTSTGAPGTVTDSDHAATATVSRGALVTVSESLDPKAGSYTTSYACTGATVEDGQFQMPVTGTVDCTVTNTAKTAQVTLTKTWMGGVAGDQAALKISVSGAPNTGYISTSTGGNQTDKTGATATVPQGAEVTVGESLDPSNGTYTTSYACTDESGAVRLSDNGFVMPAGNVSCVVTNTAQTGTVTLTKTWVRGVAGDKANLSIAVPGVQDVTYTSTSNGGDQTDKSGATGTVSTGSTVTIGEKIDPSKGSYTTTYRCTDSEGMVALSANGFTMPKGDVDCVITNTAPVPVTPVTPGMANTGSDLFGPLGLGGLMLAFGAGLVFWMRRRRLQE